MKFRVGEHYPDTFIFLESPLCNAGNKESGGTDDTPAIEQIIQFRTCAAGGPVAYT
jgi:hypothetical protein